MQTSKSKIAFWITFRICTYNCAASLQRQKNTPVRNLMDKEAIGMPLLVVTCTCFSNLLAQTFLSVVSKKSYFTFFFHFVLCYFEPHQHASMMDSILGMKAMLTIHLTWPWNSFFLGFSAIINFIGILKQDIMPCQQIMC